MKRLIASLVVCAALLGLANLPDAVAQDGKWATIKGRIIWGGDKIPERQKIAIPDANADKQVCTKDGDIYDEKWVVNPKNKGLRYTFVWLAPADPKDKTATLPIHPDLKAQEQGRDHRSAFVPVRAARSGNASRASAGGQKQCPLPA
jgi:hypothetical protein